jgi:hypothetical protein
MDLLAFERKLDQTIMRKRVDIQEALKRPMKVTRIIGLKYLTTIIYFTVRAAAGSLAVKSVGPVT